MTDTNQVAAQSAVEETTQTNSPQVEAQPIEEQTPQVQSTVEPELPADETEQRRAFQEQRIRNKQLEEELEQLKSEREERTQNESAFSSFRAAAQPVGAVDINQFTNPTTGETDWNSYNYAVNQNARQVADVQARQTVNEQLDEFQARSKYPDVFADKKVEKQIAALYLFEKINGNTNVSISGLAADFAKGQGKVLTQAEQRGAEQALTELSAKEQAAVSAQGLTSAPARQAQSAEDEERTHLTIRRGGQGATDALANALSKRRS
jgi:hypothetical protein